MTDNRTLSQALDTALDAITRAEISLGEARGAIDTVKSKITPVHIGLDMSAKSDIVAMTVEHVEQAPQEPAEAPSAPSPSPDARLSARGLLARLRGGFEKAVLPPFETRGDDR